MTIDDHLPRRDCDCPECIGHFSHLRDEFRNARLQAYIQQLPRTPKLEKAIREDRPHLRDAAFLRFMGRVVGDALQRKQ